MLQQIMIQQNNDKIKKKRKLADQAALLAIVQSILSQNLKLVSFEIYHNNDSPNSDEYSSLNPGDTWRQTVSWIEHLINPMFIKEVYLQTYKSELCEFKIQEKFEDYRAQKQRDVKTRKIIETYQLVVVHFIDGNTMTGRFKNKKGTKK